jgi:hypothetical protein
MTHKFTIGQEVEYHPARRRPVPPGPYVVNAVLPIRDDGQLGYRIKHQTETHERVALESELEARE